MIRMYEEDLLIFLSFFFFFFSRVKSLEIRDETKMRSEEVKTEVCARKRDKRQHFSSILQYNPGNTIRMCCSHYVLHHDDAHSKISRNVM